MSAVNFCGNCGSPLDPKTGKCPNCEPPKKNKKKKQTSFLTTAITVAIVLLVAAAGVGIYALVHHKNAEKLTRYEWVKLLCEEYDYDLETAKKTDPVFSDVSKDDPYYPYVQAAAAWGILDAADGGVDTETTDSTTKPSDVTTKQGSNNKNAKEDKSSRPVFGGDETATESFVGVTGARSVGETRVRTILKKDRNEPLTSEDYFSFARKEKISRHSKNREVTKENATDRAKAVTDVIYSPKANPEYTDIELKDGVISLKNDEVIEFKAEENTIGLSKDKVTGSLKKGSMVEFYGPDSVKCVKRVTEVEKTDSTVVAKLEDPDLDEIFEHFEACECIPITGDMVNRYLKSIALPKSQKTELTPENKLDAFSADPGSLELKENGPVLKETSSSVKIANTEATHAGFKYVCTISNQEMGLKNATIKLSFEDEEDSGNNCEVTIDPKKLPDNALKAVESQVEKAAGEDAGKVDEKTDKTLTFTLELKDLTLMASAYLVDSETKIDPNMELTVSATTCYLFNGKMDEEFNIPIFGTGAIGSGEAFKLFEDYAKLDATIYFNGKLNGTIDSSITIPARMSMAAAVQKGTSFNASSDVDWDLKAQLNGELGIKPNFELTILPNNKKNAQIKADEFLGIGAEMKTKKHEDYSVCSEITTYAPASHGKFTASIHLKKDHKIPEHKFPTIDATNAKFHGTCHYEQYLNGDTPKFVEECTYQEPSEKNEPEVTTTTPNTSNSGMSPEQIQAYQDIVRSWCLFDGNNPITYYLLVDIDHDGIKELFIDYFPCEAEREYIIYTYIPNSGAQEIGRTAAFHSWFVEYNNMLIHRWQHMGGGGAYHISKEGNSITIKQLFDGEDNAPELQTYDNNGRDIESYPCTELSHIK